MSLDSMLVPILWALMVVPGAPCRGDTAEVRSFGLDSRPAARAFLNLPPDKPDAMPAMLSQTRAFRETRSLSPGRSLIPYDLIVSFWSDGAVKSRWISVPNEISGASSRIRFSPIGEWKFPTGTVFVKHFELATDESRPGVRQRLETRLLVCDSSGGVYGAGYKWRADNSDADLVKEGRLESIAIRTRLGTRTQNWYYPSQADCLRCHTASAGGVLGVKSGQLNKTFTYSTGITDNQLRTWNHLGLFETFVAEADIPHLAKLARSDDANRTLEDRARSYLDVNCAYCHRPGGVVADFDARFDIPLVKQSLLGQPVRINLAIDGARLLAPNDPWRSVVLVRVNTIEPVKMPPLAHEVLDREAVGLLRAWIESLPGPPVMGPPTIHPQSGDYRGPVRVALGHGDPTAIIHYTLDGSAPGKSSPVYAGAFEIQRSATVRARAYRTGSTRSISVQETFIIGE
jgi:uncharacterized repeat protein (TIGR03806 family)